VVTAGVTTTLAGDISGAADSQGTFSQFYSVTSQQGYTSTLAGNSALWNLKLSLLCITRLSLLWTEVVLLT
jgi:hypothetical protein